MPQHPVLHVILTKPDAGAYRLIEESEYHWATDLGPYESPRRADVLPLAWTMHIIDGSCHSPELQDQVVDQPRGTHVYGNQSDSGRQPFRQFVQRLTIHDYGVLHVNPSD